VIKKFSDPELLIGLKNGKKRGKAEVRISGEAGISFYGAVHS